MLKHSERGKKWQVSLDGKEMARFSVIEEAVQAVDYEIDRRGRAAAASARPDAAWRHSPSSATPEAGASTASLADTLRLAVWQRIIGR